MIQLHLTLMEVIIGVIKKLVSHANQTKILHMNLILLSKIQLSVILTIAIKEMLKHKLNFLSLDVLLIITTVLPNLVILHLKICLISL